MNVQRVLRVVAAHQRRLTSTGRQLGQRTSLRRRPITTSIAPRASTRAARTTCSGVELEPVSASSPGKVVVGPVGGGDGGAVVEDPDGCAVVDEGTVVDDPDGGAVVDEPDGTPVVGGGTVVDDPDGGAVVEVPTAPVVDGGAVVEAPDGAAVVGRRQRSWMAARSSKTARCSRRPRTSPPTSLSSSRPDARRRTVAAPIQPPDP